MDVVIHIDEKNMDVLKGIHELSNDERIIVLVSGFKCLKINKRMMSSIGQKEMYEEIEKRFEEDITRLETEKSRLSSLMEQKDSTMDENIERIVSHKVSVYNRVNDEKQETIHRLNDLIREKEFDNYTLREKVRTIERDISVKIEEEVNEKMKIERQKRDEVFGELLEKSATVLESVVKSNSVKTSSEIGLLGEKQFFSIAKETFNDFDGFDLVDVHNQPHKGDFHLSIKGLTIMVDAKAYKRNVDSPQIDKIKSDLRRNNHIHFAWLVSLNTNIDKRDKAVFMFEWISDNQCVVHVNNLLSLENKESVLKTIFYLCQDHYKRIVDGKLGNEELLAIRESHLKVTERVTQLKKRMKELKTTLNGLKNLHDQLEKDIVNLLNSESNDLVNKYYGIVLEWWKKHLCIKKGGKLKSTQIWSLFKKDNDQLCKTDLDVSSFKEMLYLIVPEDKLVKAKGKGGAIDILDISWIENVQEEKQNEINEVIPVINVNTEVLGT